VRLRVTASAVGATAIGLAVLAIAVVVLFRQAQTDRLRVAAEAEATRVAASLAAGRTPLLQPPRLGDQLQLLVQVLDDSGFVVLSNLVDVPAPAAPSATVRSLDRQFRQLDEGQIATSRRVETPDGDRTVVVASPLARVARSVELLRETLVLGSPFLLLLVGLVAWIAVGRALSPIERLRAEASDISSRTLDRRLEEPATGDEVDRLARTMNQLLDRVEEASRRQHRFVADASHELRSPLATLRAVLEVAAASGEQPAAHASLADVHRLEVLVDDLLTRARLEEPEGVLTEVDLDELVGEEVSRVRGVAVRTSEVSGGRVVGSPRQLTSVVRNLLENASRHARSRVAVEVRTVEGTVVLAVTDDGDGIPPADRERVFERFMRLDDARTRSSGGVGLGLALVRRVVEHHGGTVTVGAAVEGGARVEVRLPAATPARTSVAPQNGQPSGIRTSANTVQTRERGSPRRAKSEKR
jgi:signal transduction histidine kinase